MFPENGDSAASTVPTAVATETETMNSWVRRFFSSLTSSENGSHAVFSCPHESSVNLLKAFLEPHVLKQLGCLAIKTRGTRVVFHSHGEVPARDQCGRAMPG